MFSFLRRLFTGGSQDRSGNKATSRRTPLREFIEDNCSLQTANRAFTSTADKREGFAASLSVLVFSVVKDMAAGVTDIPEMQREMTLDKGWEAYDILSYLD